MSKNTNLSFLTDYITADITNGRIGINNTSPAYAFDVTGIARTSTSTYLATASGNVGIGTSSPTNFTNQTSLTINGIGVSRLDMFVSGTRKGGMVSAGDATYVEADTAIPLIFNTNGGERMRIDSNGNVYIGTTDPNATNFGMALLANGEIDISRSSGTNFVMNRSTTNGQIIDFRYNNTQVGSISTNSNSLPSDLNFKKDISEISIGLNLVNKLRPVHYRHKLDEDNEALSNGIIAQELEQSLLDCGIEKNTLLMLQHKPNEKENESQYWVDYTKMIPILIKAIQELSAKVSLLENK